MEQDHKHKLLAGIADRSVQVGVIGLGYVGLPLATIFAEAGYRVVGVDIDPRKVRLLNEGRSYIEDIAEERLASLVEQGRLSATTDFAALDACDVVSICAPWVWRRPVSSPVPSSSMRSAWSTCDWTARTKASRSSESSSFSTCKAVSKARLGRSPASFHRFRQT